MRVLVLSTLFPNARRPLLGMFLRRRTAALAKLCEVKVVAPCTDADVPEREQVGDLDVIRPRWRRVPKLGVLVDGRTYARAALAAIRRHCPGYDFDVIDAHWLYPDGFAGVVLGERLGKPVTVTGRGTDVNEHCFRWPLRRLARRALRGATRLVAVSRRLKEKMVEAGGEAERISVIHNGVDAQVFHPAADRAAARGAVGVPSGLTTLLSAGGLVEAKGFQDLIEGLALLPPEPPLHLYIAGEGPYRGALERLVAERGLGSRVTLLGCVEPRELADWHRAADVFCLGSWREGCPNVVIEALACGTPVVSADVGAVPELLDGERCGVLFEPRSPQAFAAALRQALAREWSRRAIAEWGGRRSWSQVADDYCAVFASALQAGRASA